MRSAAGIVTVTGHPWPHNATHAVDLSGLLPRERVYRTLAAMAAMAHSGAVCPSVRRLVGDGKRYGTEVETLSHLWGTLKRTQVHEEDPIGREVLRHPEQSATSILRDGNFLGDCDDVAMLAASICVVLNIACSFRVTRRLAEWEHVYVLAGNEYTYSIDPQETRQFAEERKYADAITVPVWEPIQ